MNKPSRGSLLRFFTHLLVLCMLFVLPELVMSPATGRPLPMVWRFYVKAVVYVAVFYIQYYAVMRTPVSRRMFSWRMVLGSLAVIALALLMLWVLRPPMPPREAHEAAHHIGPNRFGWLMRDLVMVVLTMALAAALKMGESLTTLERNRRELEEKRRAQELAHLRSQLNPHFLFNALNTIYALTEIDTARSREAISTLSRLLRHSLYETDKPTVELGRELDFVNDYVQLMATRLAGSVKINLSIECPESARTMPIAPMLFITLVENAFKHGLTGRPDAEITIAITASESGAVECRVVNHVAHTTADSDAGGVGLTNLRRRLQLIYGRRATLTVQRSASMHCVELDIHCVELDIHPPQ